MNSTPTKRKYKKKSKSPAIYRAPALEKGLDIMELLSTCTTAMSLSEIAIACKRTISEVQRMISCLHSRGYLLRNAQAGYSLSSKLFFLAYSHPPLRTLTFLALPHMQKYTEETKESCYILKIENSDVLCVAESKGDFSTGLFIKPEKRHSALDTVSGMTILAYVPEESVKSTPILADLTPEELQALQPKFEQIRRDGIYHAPRQNDPEITAISVPIRAGENGPVFAVLTATFLTSRLENHGEKLRQTAAEISKLF